MRYWLVMPAAGAGRRFGGAKQFAALRERTVLEMALQPFIDDAQCQGGAIVLALGEPRRAELRELLPARFDSSTAARRVRIRCSMDSGAGRARG